MGRSPALRKRDGEDGVKEPPVLRLPDEGTPHDLASSTSPAVDLGANEVPVARLTPQEILTSAGGDPPDDSSHPALPSAPAAPASPPTAGAQTTTPETRLAQGTRFDPNETVLPTSSSKAPTPAASSPRLSRSPKLTPTSPLLNRKAQSKASPQSFKAAAASPALGSGSKTAALAVKGRRVLGGSGPVSVAQVLVARSLISYFSQELLGSGARSPR